MKASNLAMMDSLQSSLAQRGITMSYSADVLSGMTLVRLKKGKQAIFHTFSDYEGDVELRLKEMCDELCADDREEVDSLKAELVKYKAAVKQLSFDLEMQSTTPRAVATEADIRKQTLEMAADFLMDYGVIKTGTELESVCNQMKKLHPSKAQTMTNAMAKMEAAFGGKSNAPF